MLITEYGGRLETMPSLGAMCAQHHSALGFLANMASGTLSYAKALGEVDADEKLDDLKRLFPEADVEYLSVPLQ